MTQLLKGAPSTARRCLERQLGTIASRNSCSGPWTASLNVNLSLDPLRYRLPRRTNLSINFNNPLAGLDLLVNGEENQEGWGQASAAPDPTLLYVRGFDAETNKFRYEVNPRFGDARASRAASRNPFLVTLVFSVDVAPEPAKQTLSRTMYNWSAGRSQRPTEAQLKQTYANSFGAPYRNLLRQRDTLKFTPQQTDSATKLNNAFVAKLDAIWTPVVKYVAEQGNDAKVGMVWDRIRDAQRSSYNLQAEYGPAIKKLLTSEQVRRLPNSILTYMDRKLITDIQRAQGVR